MQVELDFDVWKALTFQRRAASDTINDVLRRLLHLPGETREEEREGARYLRSRGGTIPVGSRLRKHYDGRWWGAEVTETGILRLDDNPNRITFPDPSSTAMSITGYHTNGWKWWECRTPNSDTWVLLDDVRRGR